MEEPINVTDGAFERVVLGAALPVVAAFWSRVEESAAPLRQVLATAARQYASQVRVVALEAEDAPQTRARFGVDSLPQFLFFRNGRLVARARGLPTIEGLRPWVEFLLGQGPPPTPAASPTTTSAAHPLTVTDADFGRLVLEAPGPALVDFWAAWCGPCRMLAPTIERLASTFAGRARVAKLDVDANPLTAQRYGVQSIPTLIIFKNGQEVDRLVGVQPERVIRERLEEHL